MVVGVLVILLAAVALAAPSGGTAGGDEAEERPYAWGDELHEFSYRHPWDDEDPWNG